MNITNKVSDDTELWHARMGHPSKMVLSHLPFSLKCSDSNVCNACHIAKQTRLPFTPSTSSSYTIFDLLHIDV